MRTRRTWTTTITARAAPDDEAAAATVPTATTRRTALAGAAILTASPLLSPSAALALPARGAADAKAVGSYLPPLPASLTTAQPDLPPDYVFYTPDARTTPATRAGVIKPNPQFYQFALAPTMKQQPIVNALTGGFCFPNCVEPWYEAVFADPALGKVYVCAIIIQKLVASAKADGSDGKTVKDLGTPEAVARAVGPLITGQGYEDEDLIASSSTRKVDAPGGGSQQLFYDLELLASTADPAGPHRLAAVTVKDGLVYLFVGAATERQWSKGGGEAALRAMVASFRA
jgi:hypothetical protein